MRRWRIKGNTEVINANCGKQALLKLVDEDDYIGEEQPTLKDAKNFIDSL